MENEKVLEKIKKLFELSRNNPSEEEAKSAALKAQELLAQYHIEMAEVEAIDLNNRVEEIDEIGVDTPAKKWKYTLAHIVAPNNYCTCFWNGKSRVVFYGHKTDALAAAEMFKYLFRVGNSLATKLYQEARCKFQNTENIYNSCVMGFCQGIKDALAEQSKALMVIVPEDVKEQYKVRSAGFGTFHSSAPSAYRRDAYTAGRESGYNAMKRRALNG